jgi:hypothetical protein
MLMCVCVRGWDGGGAIADQDRSSGECGSNSEGPLEGSREVGEGSSFTK